MNPEISDSTYDSLIEYKKGVRQNLSDLISKELFPNSKSSPSFVYRNESGRMVVSFKLHESDNVDVVASMPQMKEDPEAAAYIANALKIELNSLSEVKLEKIPKKEQKD